MTLEITRILLERTACFFVFLLLLTAGGARDRASPALTKTLALVCDIAPGRWSYVPALRRTYVSAKLSHSLLRSKRLMQR